MPLQVCEELGLLCRATSRRSLLGLCRRPCWGYPFLRRRTGRHRRPFLWQRRSLRQRHCRLRRRRWRWYRSGIGILRRCYLAVEQIAMLYDLVFRGACICKRTAQASYAHCLIAVAVHRFQGGLKGEWLAIVPSGGTPTDPEGRLKANLLVDRAVGGHIAKALGIFLEFLHLLRYLLCNCRCCSIRLCSFRLDNFSLCNLGPS
mmetsp:Transcript_52891/g.113378  ORF Transcript_52891/g.113378 Transcript_52891/m.113378 type:complete len:203 (+) Transcript_52891:1582-2190(+)